VPIRTEQGHNGEGPQLPTFIHKQTQSTHSWTLSSFACVCVSFDRVVCVCVCVCVCVVFLCGSFSVCFSVCVKKQVNGFRFSVYGLQNHPGDFCFGDFFGFGRRSVCWLLLLISNKSV
jgi:hypothetical protein